MRFTLFVLGLVITGAVTHGASPAESATQPRAFVWVADVPGGVPDFARNIGGVVGSAGFAIELLDSAGLTNLTRLTTHSCDLLVVPNARILPVESIPAVTNFLKQGGNLLALGLSAWETPTFRLADRWTSREEYAATLAQVRPERRLLDLAGEAVSRWPRHSNSPQRPSKRELVSDGGPAVRVNIETLDGWDTLEIPSRAWRFEPGQMLTCFRAKGNAATKQLAVEWIERDSSRWIATVDLSTNWQHYALPPEAFRPWTPPAGRGGAGDQLNLDNIARFTLGLAHTHTSIESGPLAYWFADLGTAANPFGNNVLPPTPTIPRLESLSPGYQTYPITTPVTVQPRAWQAVLREESATSPPPSLGPLEGLRGLHPRPRGVGWKQGRPWRWEPFLGARDARTGDYRGAVGALVAHEQQGVWLLLTPEEPSFYANATTRSWLRKSLQRLRDGLFLTEGGAEFFTLFPDQAVRIGARVQNRSRTQSAKAEVMLTVLAQKEDRELFRHRVQIEVAAGGVEAAEAVWSPSAWPAGGCVVAVQLLRNGEVVDELFHELNRWQPTAQPAFVEARDGGFWLGGRPWKAHGVNYLPSSGIGVATKYFEFWLGRGAYDPEVIERDLRRVKGMGLNSVSAFVYHRDLGAQHLLDFLFRCERLGLKVNLSLRPGTPMEFRWREMKALIERYRLAENDTVMAYDLAWEPSHFDHAFQTRHYAALWDAWVLKRHSSLDAAARALELNPTEVRNSGSARIAIPHPKQLLNDGPWRRLAADYRRFLDELLAEKYAEARRLVRSIDPRHPVSFRMQHAGDPTHLMEHLLPYELWGLRDAVDIWEPEAYGRIGDWERVKPGHFTAAYARLCDPTKPVLWSEMGVSVLDPNTQLPSPAKLEFAARYYRDFYRMLRESGADGVFFWWYAGGFRLNENSDYGILSPDGTDRAVTRVIRDEGAQYFAAPKTPPPAVWIAVDRDRDARGLPGIYEAVKAEYWRAIEAGRSVGLQWTRQPGTE